MFKTYTFFQILSQVGREINTNRDLKKIFTELKQTIFPMDIEECKDLRMVLKEKKENLTVLMGQELYSALSTHKYIIG